MNMNTGLFKKATFLGVFIAIGAYGQVQAIPNLQLDINPGVYVGGLEQTTFATSNIFDLNAYMQRLSYSGSSDYFYISIAVSPKQDDGSSIGSFTVGGTSYGIGDFIYGNPPIGWVDKGGQLGSHDVFETYFMEIEFKFDGTQVSAYNVQDGVSEQGDMYKQSFAFDTSGLLNGISLHFDLYNKKEGNGGDLDVDKFAPFSHDAESGTPVPEPATMLLFGAGLAGLAGFARRKVQ